MTALRQLKLGIGRRRSLAAYGRAVARLLLVVAVFAYLDGPDLALHQLVAHSPAHAAAGHVTGGDAHQHSGAPADQPTRDDSSHHDCPVCHTLAACAATPQLAPSGVVFTLDCFPAKLLAEPRPISRDLSDLPLTRGPPV